MKGYDRLDINDCPMHEYEKGAYLDYAEGQLHICLVEFLQDELQIKGPRFNRQNGTLTIYKMDLSCTAIDTDYCPTLTPECQTLPSSSKCVIRLYALTGHAQSGCRCCI